MFWKFGRLFEVHAMRYFLGEMTDLILLLLKNAIKIDSNNETIQFGKIPSLSCISQHPILYTIFCILYTIYFLNLYCNTSMQSVIVCFLLFICYFPFLGENIALGQTATQSDTLWDFTPGGIENKGSTRFCYSCFRSGG